MPEIVLHIGPHKTGTSHIQACLKHHAPALEALGVHVPRAWEDTPLNPSHTGLIARLNSERRDELRPVFAAWRRSRYRTIAISCEELGSLEEHPVKARMLYELTEGMNVRVVFYVRRWTTLLASVWQEYIKQGSTLTLPEVAAHNLADPAASRIINIDTRLGIFAELFGISSIHVVGYNALVDSGVDIFEDFATRFLHAPGLPKLDLPPANPSMSYAQAEMMRLFNILQQGTGRDGRPLLRFLLTAYPPAPLAPLLRNLEGHDNFLELRDDSSAVLPVLRDNAAKYGEGLWPKTVAPLLYQPRPARLPYVRTDAMLAPGFAERTRALWKALSAMGTQADATAAALWTG
jgi:hypothetical protein